MTNKIKPTSIEQAIEWFRDNKHVTGIDVNNEKQIANWIEKRVTWNDWPGRFMTPVPVNNPDEVVANLNSGDKFKINAALKSLGLEGIPLITFSSGTYKYEGGKKDSFKIRIMDKKDGTSCFVPPPFKFRLAGVLAQNLIRKNPHILETEFDPMTVVSNWAIDMQMIYDAYTGEHDPKIFEVDTDLWTKLISTDISGLGQHHFKMPFDTMVIRFGGAIEVKSEDILPDMELGGLIEEFVVTHDNGEYAFYFPWQLLMKSNNGVTRTHPNPYMIIMKPDLFDGDLLTQVNKILNHQRADNPEHTNKVATDLVMGFFNLLLYINSVNREVSKSPATMPKRSPITGKKIASTYETFTVRRSVKLKSREDNLVHINIDGHHIISCPKWDVRGHWRNQAYGEDHKLRKLKWIEPYTKGIFRDDADLNSVTTDYVV